MATTEEDPFSIINCDLQYGEQQSTLEAWLISNKEYMYLQNTNTNTNHLLTRMDPDGHSTVYTLFDNNEQFKT